MSEERMSILKMLESGQISAQEAADLLAALDRAREEAAAAVTPARWLRVKVISLDTNQDKFNFSLPLGLAEVVLQLGARFTPKDVPVDPQQILEAIHRGGKGKIVEAEDLEKGERAEIYLE